MTSSSHDPIDHAVHVELPALMSEFHTPAATGKARQQARTIVRSGPLRVTLIALGPDGHIPLHRAGGPITVQVLAGELSFVAGGDQWALESGDLISLPAGVEHEVSSALGGTFLLTRVIA